MMPEPAAPRSLDVAHRFAIGRLSDADTRWRVVVEAWPETAGGYRGRLVFQVDDETGRATDREGPVLLHGGSVEDVARAAHEVPEDRLRMLLRSLA